jgi:hypothetical protein
MVAVRRFLLLAVAAQACASLSGSRLESINRSPCFVYVDSSLGLGPAPARQQFVRLLSRPSDLPGGNALEFYRDSTLSARGGRGTWQLVGHDTLRFDFWLLLTSDLTLHRQDSHRWTGEMSYGGDVIVGGKPVRFHSRVTLSQYRCPAPA